ncbi:redoxin domain-containing protein [Ruixingdingia sedimenti]|uniref:TlpA family protein disulfide reductase n=1 Tax=Ruixingdingia sedimenti TaxID=3073604 RepID=A0ABU1FB60_9RHOB|nr:redoxin domain-containing protein [Xinfangfangia sp. LG-4]MDR5654138.1 TlpA family protein disulfide reductase [Xinfangfangia sp. LG-4]
MTDPCLPGLQAAEWLNTDRPPGPDDLRGKVVAVEAFQMLCPGCVSHGLPQAQRIAQTFRREDVAVIGLHAVFEHHAAMTPVSLAAFLHEYRIGFPVAVDQPGPAALPLTMRNWGLEGTPTLLLFDRQGRMRARHLGQVADMAVGAEIMALVMEPPA